MGKFGGFNMSEKAKVKYTIKELYGNENETAQTERYKKAIDKFKELYGDSEYRIFSASGRTEVGGNHTDHNLGKVLAAGVSLDVIAIVRKTDDNVIEVKSEGFPKNIVDLSNLSVIDSEKGNSSSLIRGVAAGFKNKNYGIGGFKAYTTSNVLKGSGLSSSAAFEVLIGTILNYLYNDLKATNVEIAQIAQYAENIYFGKPSGLMDQMASSVGSFITIDFKDAENPVIEKINFDFAKCGYSLCIVDTKGSHEDLTPEYAAIPDEMKSVAKFFGKKVLREVTLSDVLENINTLREKLGDRAVLRSLHFLDENKTVEREANALKNGDFKAFLKEVTKSGNSSYKYLQNIYANKNPNEQGLAIGLNLAEMVLDGEGACRVHGGGFAGTIQAFVPNDKLDKFKKTLNGCFGDGSCHIISIRPVGGIEVADEI